MADEGDRTGRGDLATWVAIAVVVALIAALALAIIHGISSRASIVVIEDTKSVKVSTVVNRIDRKLNAIIKALEHCGVASVTPVSGNQTTTVNVGK